MRRLTALLVLTLARPAPAQVELKWKWTQGQTFWVQTTTLVEQSFVVEDSPAIRAPADFKPAEDGRTDRQLLEQILRVTRADPIVRGILSRRVGAAFAAAGPLGAGSLPAVGMLTPYRLAWEREVRQRYEFTTFLRYTVKKRNDDGSAVLTQRVEKDRTVIKPAPRSDKPEDRPDIGLDDVELTLHVDARGVVTKVEGAGPALVAKIAGNDSGRRKALEEALSEETIKASATQSLGLFPDGPVKPGDTWGRPAELKLGALGSAKLRREFRLLGTRQSLGGKVADLVAEGRLTDYRPAAESKDLLTQVADARWTVGEGRTEIEVDVDAGRPLESKGKVTLAGFVTLANPGSVYRGRVKLEQTVTTKLFDRLPPLKKEEPKQGG